MDFSELGERFEKIASANVAAGVTTAKGNPVLWQAREAIDLPEGKAVPFGPVVLIAAKEAAKDTTAQAAKDTAAPSADSPHDAAVARLVASGLLPARDTAKRRALIAAAVMAGSIPAP